MTTTRTLFALALALTVGAFAAPAQAGGRYYGGHHHGYYGSRFVFGFSVGAPWPYYSYYPYPYYAPYAYYPPYVVQQQPQVYVEQPQAQPSQPSGYWYYCADSRAYYPYVKECASAWQRVAPQPQN